MPDAVEPRRWGYWTQEKLRVLHEYLDAFTTTSTASRERVYLDAFAGLGEGADRLTGQRFEGSVRIALGIENPPFTRFRFFEIRQKADRLRHQLDEDFPGRDIRVYSGDCNQTIPQALADLQDLRWAPTFAFLDPDGMELAWETLAALAGHKRGYRRGVSKPEYKIEMWILFPSQGLIRILELKKEPTDRNAAQATRLFGTDAWRVTHRRRRAGEIDGRTAREEYVNLMRWRLEEVLGYQWTHPLEVKNLRGGPLYHMILATDNEAGTRIISDLYSKAALRIPQMREEILERLRTEERLRLFAAPIELPKRLYRYKPPTEPEA